MTNETIEQRSAGGWPDTLATVAGILLLALVVVVAGLFTADAFLRILAGRPILPAGPSEALPRYAGLGVGAVTLLALPAGLAATLVRRGDLFRRSQSALALVPGLPLGLVVAIAAALAMASSVDGGIELAFRAVAAAFGRHGLIWLPLAILVAAVFGGARTPETIAIVAAPSVLIGLYAAGAETSLASLFVAAAVPALVLIAAFSVYFAFAPARAVLPWIVGLGLATGIAVLSAPGLWTPAEVWALVALIGLAVALPVRAFAVRRPIVPVLRQAAIEAAAVAVTLAAMACTFSLYGLWQVGPAVSAVFAESQSVAVPIAAAAFAIVSWLATPALGLALLLPALVPAIVTMGFNPIWFGTLLMLLGLAAVAARSGRGAGAPDALAFSAGTAWLAALVIGALAALAGVVPGLVLALVRAWPT